LLPEWFRAGAYPRGYAAFVFRPETANRERATFTPFDTGAVANSHLEPANTDPAWGDPDVRRAFVEEHTGYCTDLDEFARHYLNAHFRDIRNYVTLPQDGKPDWPPYHGLRSADGVEDRRAWTIEVRIPHHIPVQEFQALILEREDLLAIVVEDSLFDDSWTLIIASNDSPGNPLKASIDRFILDEYF
jgi:hypothetical protein